MNSLTFLYRLPIFLAFRVGEWTWVDTSTAIAGLSEIVDRCDKTALDTGLYSSAQIQDARLAVVAFIDEKVNLAIKVSAAGIHRYNDWLTTTLGVQILKHGVAGQRFFDRLTPLIDPNLELSTGDAALLELFTLCLQLGFKGQYNKKPEELENRRKDCLMRLADAESNKVQRPLFAPILVHPHRGTRRALWSIIGSAILVLVIYTALVLYGVDLISRVHIIATEVAR